MRTLDSNHPFDEFTQDWLDRPVAARYAHIAARYPDKIAVDDGERSLTYAELRDLSSAIAQRIAQMTPPDAPIGIAIENDVRFPAAMLACLSVGRPYVPLDASLPEERKRLILEHAGVAALITDGDVGTGRRGNLPQESAPSDIAYILYTSGTTGQPKGVYQNQRGLMYDVCEYTNAVRLSATDRVTQLYSPSVNGAIRDIFGALLNGATLHIVDLRRKGFGEIRRVLREKRITIYHSMPPVLRAFMRGLDPREMFESVRLVYLAGDRLFRQDVMQCWTHLAPYARIYTGIGATEVATLYRQWFLTPDTPLKTDLVPVGYAIPQRTSIVSDGEIIVSSPYLAQGYWKGRAFSDRVFHTGDLGYEDETGLLHFIGRKDRQLKIRGYRVEPAEAEAGIRSCRGVLDAAVVVSGGALHALAVLTRDTAAQSVLTELRGRLPAHLIPQTLQAVSAIPTLANFKPDWKAIADCTAIDSLSSKPPSSEPMDVVTRVWSQTLGVANPHISWEAAGGDSLRMLELLLRLEQALGRRLPVSLMSTAMTLQDLTDALHAPPAVQTKACAAASILFLAPGLGGADLNATSLARSLEDFASVEVLDYGICDAVAAGSRAFAGLTNRLLAHILQVAGTRPISLAGFSFGGRIAFELACRLPAAQVKKLFLLDCSPSGVSCKRSATAHVLSPTRIRRKIVREWMRLLARRHWFRGIRASCLLAGDLGFEREAREIAAREIRLSTSPRVPNQKYRGRITLIRTDDETLTWAHGAEDLGWSEYCGGTDVITIRGVTHLEMLSSPELAPAIRTCLAAMRS